MSDERVMLLIDADNVSIDVIEQAVQQLLEEHGALHVRRAYCTAESALKHQAVFKRLGIRPMVNLAAGKNSTDIALAVDAIDLVLAERPEVVVIASSDSDFAPLVGRLREKGCRVVGIGQEGKTGDETRAAYDEFTTLAHRPAQRPAERSARAAPAKKAARRKAAPAELPQTVRQILAALPELARGETVELRVASERLRAAELLGPKASSTRFFAPLADRFELLPDKQPNKVRWREAAAGT